MNKLPIILILFSGFTFSCFRATEKEKPAIENLDSIKSTAKPIVESDSSQIKKLIQDFDLNRIDTVQVGDVNGDGIKDKAIILPLNIFFHNNKMDSQFVNIAFSCPIPQIKHYNGFHGIIASVGDLDGNGTDEIVYMPDWYQSNWAGFFIYGYRRNKWTLFGEGSIRRDMVSDAKDPIAFLKRRVKKINSRSFLITDNKVTEGGDFIDSTRTVQIK